ncbi:hypothetical protein SPRG_06833 [Saprolegnia parasitica CBS 223.65]|uniref:START domain-containing protein n=1 Tax=Saprolegnia parasitica (strain CBS 223.65) TaxID=695850 RepID=A0A067CLY5_SAPPC|nr:hypothetical protein SPRG_06833 [Saprolegnia parasitica CBS 223.65]KDO27566.1 hypothetical protein SPRG_06833 [Saprolegnia parasitica CBS 223.65]|eukprot:XP_012201691.1 hypothetical protein SPRG_06833 [Saprolegnia parasitica CBS 223.65]
MKSHPPACVSIPDVTIEDHDALLDFAHHALSDLILSARLESNSRLPWAPLASYPSQTKVYTANDPLVRDAFFAGETTLEMALEDAIAFFRVDERAEYLDHARLLARKASNACILSPLSSGSCDDPYHYVGLHWLALPLSSSSLFHQRDICYLEAHDAFHLHGARGWACVASSVRLPWFPCLEMSHQLLRATMRRSGYVLTELGPTTTRVVHVVNVDMGGHIPSVLVAKMLKAQAASVAQLAHRIRTRGTTIVSPPSTHCASCHAKFHCLKTKVECHRCGDMVCKRCILVNAQCKNCCYGHPDRVGHRQTSSSTVIAEEDNEGSDDDLSALRVGAEAQPLRRTVVEGHQFDCHVSVVSGYSI